MKRNILFQIFSLQILTSSFAERIKVNSAFFYYLDWDLEKTPGMSSFVTIGHELWIILTARTTYHFLVCSTFHRSIMKDTNTTVGYPYNYHYCTYVQFFFYFHVTSVYYILGIIHCICLKRVHTIELLLSGRILISNGYL